MKISYELSACPQANRSFAHGLVLEHKRSKLEVHFSNTECYKHKDPIAHMIVIDCEL